MSLADKIEFFLALKNYEHFRCAEAFSGELLDITHKR